MTPSGASYGRWYFGALVALMLVLNVGNALYQAAGSPMPPGASGLIYVVFSAVIYFWFQRFSAQHHLGFPLDMGWFLYLAWWAIVPFYLFKVRGVRAAWTLLAFLGAYLATYGVSVLLWALVRS